MPQKLPRFYVRQQKAEDERKVAAILLESGETSPDARTLTRVSHADPARLRGLPAVGRSVAGAIPGTDPLGALVAKERQRQ